MILIIWNKKHKQYIDIETMKRKLGLTKIDKEEEKFLIQASKRGDYLFGDINPYQSEMSTGEPVMARELLLAKTQEELNETQWVLQGQV